jgi:hypothetical protein
MHSNRIGIGNALETILLVEGGGMLVGGIYHHIPRPYRLTRVDATFKSFQQQVSSHPLPLKTVVNCEFGEEDCGHFSWQ